MLTEFPCPVCGRDDWRAVRTYRYRRDDPAVRRAYIERRRQVLLDVWSGGVDEVMLTSRFCRVCGFMTYAPRPSAADMDAKWAHFAALRAETSTGSAEDVTPDARQAIQAQAEVNHPRAERVFGHLRGHVNGQRLRVLDFGGGTGQLLIPFLERGDDCYVVDYCPQQLAGVRKISDTLDGVPAALRFDLIICSHVLEHLAEPGETLAALKHMLADDGLIYGEVPLEIWGRIPIVNDPVTHINFFTMSSFRELFVRRGMRVLHSERIAGSYQDRQKDVLVVVAGLGGELGGLAPPHGARATERLLHPPWWARLRRRAQQRWQERASGKQSREA